MAYVNDLSTKYIFDQENSVQNTFKPVKCLCLTCVQRTDDELTDRKCLTFPKVL